MKSFTTSRLVCSASTHEASNAVPRNRSSVKRFQPSIALRQAHSRRPLCALPNVLRTLALTACEQPWSVNAVAMKASTVVMAVGSGAARQLLSRSPKRAIFALMPPVAAAALDLLKMSICARSRIAFPGRKHHERTHDQAPFLRGGISQMGNGCFQLLIRSMNNIANVL